MLNFVLMRSTFCRGVHVIRPSLWVVLSRSLHVKALEFASFVVRVWVNPRVSKITVTHAVYTWRCWTLPLLRLEREKMHFVYEIVLLNKISRNHFLSEPLQWNYASFNVKRNRPTSISSNKIVKLQKNFISVWPLIACHSPHWNNHLNYLMHDHGILLDIFFGSRQLRAKILSKSTILERFTFKFLKNCPVSR